jgi:glycine betaine/proline transport system substrate-binding protein
LKRKKSVKILSMVLAVFIFTGFWFALFPCEVSAQDNVIRIGYVDWPGVTVKSQVAKEILEILGYEVNSQMLMLPIIFKGLDNNNLDFFLGMWYPTMRPNFTPYEEKGTIEKVRVNLDETTYKIAVPEFVWNAGVKSLADLNKHADKFNHVIVGIEPGNEGNQIMIDAIENNTYNLKDWELMESSTTAMMVAVGKAIRDNQWIAFLGWEPHWMNLEYDIKYLDDPEKIWGEGEVVYTIARSGFKEEMPNVYGLLKQIKVTPNMQNDWIYEYGKKERDPDEVAIEWIKNNLDIVDQWVYEVESINGERARDVIRSYFQ